MMVSRCLTRCILIVTTQFVRNIIECRSSKDVGASWCWRIRRIRHRPLPIAIIEAGQLQTGDDQSKDCSYVRHRRSWRQDLPVQMLAVKNGTTHSLLITFTSL